MNATGKWLDFQCKIHNHIITEELLETYRACFPAVYNEAQPMAEFLLAVAKQRQEQLVMLPFDCVTEGMAMGAKVTGFDDIYGLRPDGKLLHEVSELLTLPRLNATKGRLQEIIKAIAIIASKGYTPCLNISGFLAIGDLLLSAEKIFCAWRKQADKLLKFYQRYTEDLVQLTDAALAAGAKVVSYSDSLSAVNIIGPKMARELGQALLTPLLKQLAALPRQGVVHVCGISTAALAVAGTAVFLPQKVAAAPYQQAVITVAEETEKMKILAYGCLNRQNQTKQLVFVDFPQ